MSKGFRSITNKDTNEKKKITSKQVAAMAGVVLLALLYLTTLFTAVFGGTSAGSLFQLCIFATIALPLVIWIYVWIVGKLTNRSTIADLNPGRKHSDSSEDTSSSSESSPKKDS